MDASQAGSSKPGWETGWMVLHTKQDLPGDFVSLHAHAAEAQAEARRRGAGYQVFHGSHKVGSNEVIVD